MLKAIDQSCPEAVSAHQTPNRTSVSEILNISETKSQYLDSRTELANMTLRIGRAVSAMAVALMISLLSAPHQVNGQDGTCYSLFNTTADFSTFGALLRFTPGILNASKNLDTAYTIFVPTNEVRIHGR